MIHARLRRRALWLSAAIAMPALAAAQTDFYNTDRGRPLRTEDAYPVERRAFEIQAAPIRLERGTRGIYHWSVEPELAYGVLARTQLEIGVPFSVIDGGGVRRSGVNGLDVAILHNLNVETRLPAFGVAANALLPVGGLAPDEAYFSFTGIATKTFSWARFHVNGEYTLGDEPSPASMAIVEATRWSAGLAVDRTFPLRSLLLAAELVVQQPLSSGEEPVTLAGAGVRYQLAPRWAVDAGLGKRLTGDERPWHVTFGSAYAFGLPWR